jgi:hypothetical protein
MRVLFITRIHPDRRSSRLGRRLHERLCELSELGHEVLVFTQWRGEQIDFQLPNRIEIRFPFKNFKAWEWPMAVNLALNWRPEIVHILDPGLDITEKVFSAEVSALPLLDGLRIGSRNRLRPRAVISHLSSPIAHAKTVQFWQNLGAAATESEWLNLSVDSPSFQKNLSDVVVESPNGQDSSRANRRFVLAGTYEERPDFLDGLKDAISAIEFLGASSNLELTVFCERTRLSRQERDMLQKWERKSNQAFRLRLESPMSALEVIQGGCFDGAIVAGLSDSSTKTWAEVLPMPLVGSESQRTVLEQDARTLGLVPDVAWMTQGLARLAIDEGRNQVWTEISAGALESKRDIAVNRISRLYSQVLAHQAKPSYS